MTHRQRLLMTSVWAASMPVALMLGTLFPQPARAQTTVEPTAGLGGYYRSQRWLPLQAVLTNQGTPTRVEVRARFAVGVEDAHEYRIPERTLQSGAIQGHTLYIQAPRSYSAQTLIVDLYRDGRLLNTVRPQLEIVGEGNWLVVGIGPTSSLIQLTTVTLKAQQASEIRGGMPGSMNQTPRIKVATLAPGKAPDRWQGLQAADLVVLGDVSERDFTPEQMSALTDYVTSGGKLVITGGVNWNRLTTPAFADLLPVRVRGSTTASSLPGLRGMARPDLPPGRFALCQAVHKPGSRVLAEQGDTPLVVEGRHGSGRVVYLAFDPQRPPFTVWGGVNEMWKSILLDRGDSAILPAITMNEGDYNEYQGLGSGQARLAESPYSISQLDIPAFYVVALFLLSYIVVLVPVNYYFLKARDKKEYAWLTTPAIVALFSVGAYLIGYGFKGGRTLVVKVAVIEAHAGERTAAGLAYAGIFSPRKAGYDVQSAHSGGAGADAAATLLSEPPSARAGGLRILQDDTQRIHDMQIDMWAMRVIKAEGITRLGNGISARREPRGKQVTWTVRNDSPYSLDDCYAVLGGTSVPVRPLPAGQQISFTETPGSYTGGGTMLPQDLVSKARGGREELRVKRALLRPLCEPYQGAGAWVPPQHPMLVGWVREPVMTLQVNGAAPRERGAALMVVHLDGG